MIKTIKNFLYSLLSRNGNISTKRCIGIIIGLFLRGALILILIKRKELDSMLVDCLTVILVGVLAISITQNIFKKKDNNDKNN